MPARRFLAIPPPADPSPRWHVSPGVDLLAYAFGWAFILVPLELLRGRSAQTAMLLLVIGLTFAHRHYTLPYVYLDREVFRLHPWRFVLFPALMFLGFLASPALWNTRWRSLVAGVVLFAGVWNAWHVYMQKFGILRLYAAKGGGQVPIPRGVDKLLLFAWVPLYLVWLLPKWRDQFLFYYPTVSQYTRPLLDWLARAQPYLLVPAVATVVASLTLFVRHEWRSTRLRNLPRLWMALGTTALSASFLVCNPVHVALAFAFSHAVEYMVFVWAFQRRRYQRPLPHDPLLGRLLRRPWLAYGGYTVALVVPYLLLRTYGSLIAPEAHSPFLLGTTLERWGFYWSVYQSLVHFYYDGFLWKMRLPSVRANI